MGNLFTVNLRKMYILSFYIIIVNLAQIKKLQKITEITFHSAFIGNLPVSNCC